MMTRWRLVTAMIAAGLAGAGGAAIAGGTLQGLSFDTVFTATGEPATLHYDVQFVSNGGTHQMEIWRDHDRRVRRVTDNRIVSQAVHRPGDPGYHLIILDRQRRIATKIDRTNLYRVGNFTDWFDLTHGLRHPRSAYLLAAASAPAGMPNPVAPCRWYRLTQGAQKAAICWDGKNRIPLLIDDTGKGPIWRVTHIDAKPAPAGTFDLDLRGVTVNDANRDIQSD